MSACIRPESRISLENMMKPLATPPPTITARAIQDLVERHYGISRRRPLASGTTATRRVRAQLVLLRRLHRGVSIFFLLANRNRRSIQLDLRNDKARKIVLRPAKEADVLIENSDRAAICVCRPGTSLPRARSSERYGSGRGYGGRREAGEAHPRPGFDGSKDERRTGACRHVGAQENALCLTSRDKRWRN